MKLVVPSLVRACLCTFAILFCAYSATATPYASGVTSSGGTVSFILNESADNVTVVFDGGASTLDMGARASGQHSFMLGAATSFEIRVTKNAPAGWTQIGSDTALTRFFSGRGVAVNTFPSSPYFGRVYISTATAGTTTIGNPPHRHTGDGIYILKADLSDALGRGDTVSTAGINFTPAAQQDRTPWRIEVGKDDRLYIADYSTATGTIFRTDPDVTTSEQVLDGQGTTGNPSVHTTIGALRIFGRLEDGDLVIWGIDGNQSGSFNRIKRWNIGFGPLPWATAPDSFQSVFSGVAQLETDLDIGADGKIYASVNRFDGTDSESLRVFDADGNTLLFASRTDASAAGVSPDPFRQTRGIRVSPDGRHVASITDSNGIVITRLNNGIPNIASMQVLALMPGTNRVGRDVCFDAAGNLYAISSGLELLRAFSPGGNSTTVTRSDGTFEVIVQPLPDVSIEAIDSTAFEEGADTGTFALSRTGDLSAPLTVNYTLMGAATNGTDYQTNTLSVTFAIGEATTNIVITPIDDSVAELVETVTLALSPGTNYLRATLSATLRIVDNDFPEIHLSATDTNTYEPLAGDPVVFLLTRYGDTNADIFSIHLNSVGTATENVDFTLSANDIGMAPGVITTSVTAFPVDDRDFEADETIRLETQGSIDYAPGSPASARLQDNELPPAPVIFADDFDLDSSAGWTVLFGASNNIYDASVEWMFDYSSLGIPSAPSGPVLNTTGVRLWVNKSDSTVGGAAALNLYPTGLHFSGDYALRFDMFLQYGTPSSTEHAMAGLNHSGTKTNRVSQSPGAANTTRGGDGIWVAIITDGTANREYSAYSYPNATAVPTVLTNRTAAAMANAIPRPPYSVAGAIGNASGVTTTPSWANVELSQIDGFVTLKINNNVVWRLPAPYGFNSGNIMLGHSDQFDSVSPAATWVIFDNLQVVDLSLRIISIQVLPNNSVQIDFRSPVGGQASDFTLESTPTVGPAAWNTETSATITSQGSDFRAVVPSNGDMRFYRIRR